MEVINDFVYQLNSIREIAKNYNGRAKIVKDILAHIFNSLRICDNSKHEIINATSTNVQYTIKQVGQIDEAIQKFVDLVNGLDRGDENV